ncbi:hypothetical protein COS86_08060 [Candidatus Bathyarchaeota archaeon CG07_land_8_20_14_0_80_47_9]|jgi:hypothetical protein|nr:MAG: hypothetical protein COS86_08060 [Candidatus Bathyarchaeota archaeon CG07_land_8_20_14_0_80_47_9]
MKKRLMLGEEEGNLSKVAESSNPVLGYRLQFLSNNETQTVHKVEVKSVDFHDVIRHLRQGDSVLITPKLQENLTKKQRQNRAPWYFTHV